MHILSIYYIYTFSRFNSYFIKLVILKLYNYSFLKKIIKKIKKLFIKYYKHAYKDILYIYPIYNKVKLKLINNL